MLDEAVALLGEPSLSNNQVSGGAPIAIYNASDGAALATGSSIADLDGTALHNGGSVVLSSLGAEAVAERLSFYQEELKKK